MIDLDAIRARANAADRGPWQWGGHLTYSGPGLFTRHSSRGESSIMDFRRLDMQGAQPRFQRPNGLMEWANDPGVAIFEVCPEAMSIDDPRVYRDDIIGFRNGNAEFIAHSRQDVDDLLAEIDRLNAVIAAAGIEVPV